MNKDFKELYKVWQGWITLTLERGWRLLPIRVSDFKWSDYDELKLTLDKEISDALNKYKIDEDRIIAFSMLSNGDIAVQIDDGLLSCYITTKGN